MASFPGRLREGGNSLGVRLLSGGLVPRLFEGGWKGNSLETRWWLLLTNHRLHQPTLCLANCSEGLWRCAVLGWMGGGFRTSSAAGCTERERGGRGERRERLVV